MTIDSPTAFCSFGDEHPGSVHQSRITSCGANDVGQFANHVELLFAVQHVDGSEDLDAFLSGCVYAGKFAIQFRASLNLDLAYHRGEPLFPASPRSPRISGQVFSKLASRCSPRSSTPPMRCWASGHVSAAPNEVKASRSRSVGGNEIWLTRPFAAARARRSKEAIRRASASTKPSSSASGSARLTYPYRSAVSPSKSFAPRTISSARPRPTRWGRRSKSFSERT